MKKIHGKGRHPLIGGTESIVLKTFNEEQCVQNFQMRKETFEFLCSKLEPILNSKENIVRQPLDVKTQYFSHVQLSHKR